MKEDINIGTRVVELRRRRGLTQEELADKAGLSVPVVKKIEQGRGGCRMETYHAIARALNVVTLAFASPDSPEPQASAYQDGALADIRSAINPPTSISGQPLHPLGADEPDLAMLGQAVHSVAMAYHNDRYDTVARLVPAVVRSAHLHVNALGGDDLAQAQRLRSNILGVAGRYLIQVREHDLALMALRDSLQDALAIGDQPLAAAAVSSQAWALMRQGRFGEVEDLCASSADAVEPRVSKATADELSAWGWLLLRACAAAARNNRPEEAREYLAYAASAAAPMGREQEMTTGYRSFGPLTVALKGPETEVVLGQPDRALQLAGQLPRNVGRTSSSDWHRHGIDKAKALVMSGEVDRATQTLARLKGSAPEWLRYQQSAREVAEDIIDSRKRMPSQEQLKLADFLHIHV